MAEEITVMPAAILLAVAMLVVGWKARISYLRLPEVPQLPKAPRPDLTVIVPARNEEANIARVVESFPGLPVIVVNDASTDATESAARKAGALVVDAPPLPQGALGKPNACQRGASAADSRWLLFVDADTWYAPEFAASFVAYAEAEKLEMVSSFLRQHTLTAPERVILPYAFALYFVGVNAANVNSAISREALANGQCLLVRRDAYEKLGGHAAVLDSVIEDVALARLAKDKELITRVVRAESMGNVRMYDSLPAIWRGFEKNSFRFLQVNPVSGVIVVAASIIFTTLLPLLGLLLLERQWLAAALFALSPGVTLLPWYRTPAALWRAPLAIYLFQLIALSGMAKTILRAKTNWKGRMVG
ncbi:MAG: glycosyltransferase [Bryobacterales bacterium]|jgi:cellulose synthase/poly-beta-1,6-N-acetylglucosamine synthase-like glycosyltransferase|nr:glycosyltransferase [Bryobacterales bacterium]